MYRVDSDLPSLELHSLSITVDTIAASPDAHPTGLD